MDPHGTGLTFGAHAFLGNEKLLQWQIDRVMAATHHGFLPWDSCTCKPRPGRTAVENTQASDQDDDIDDVELVARDIYGVYVSIHNPTEDRNQILLTLVAR
jgi:hypothetical protein